jgi:hypothetical protein
MILTRHGSFSCWMVLEDKEGNLELVLFDEADAPGFEPRFQA